MTQILMVDRATPPTADELAMLRSLGVGAMNVYVGGETEAPSARAWDSYDLGQVSDLKLLPTFVGQNLPWTTDETTGRGVVDASALVAAVKGRGFGAGPACNDIEYQTYVNDPAGTSLYYRALGAGIVSGGYRPVGYQPLPMAQAYVGAGWGAWVSWWPGALQGIPDLGQLPIIRSRYAGTGWQFSDQFHGWDASVVDGEWWDMAQTVPQVLDGFATGFTIGGGIAQAWQHNGGLYAFGMPISHEYDTAANGRAVRRQWFERGIAEWYSGQWTAEWDVDFLLLGAILSAGGDRLAQLLADRAAHGSAFVL